MSAAVAPSTSTRPRIRGGLPVATVLLPVLAIVIALGLWWGLTAAFGIQSYLVPAPQLVLRRLFDNWSLLMSNAGVTLWETAVGYVIAILISLPVAMAIARFRAVEQMTYPLLLAINAVPKVAVAPILVVWMGFGQLPKIVMVVLLCFFPIVLSTVAGLRSTPPELVELAKSLNAGELRTFVSFRFPWALPQIFTGLKTAISLAVIGAVIAEFVNSVHGLGFIIVQSGGSADTAMAFAAILLLSAMSIVLFYVIAAGERLCLPWAREQQR